MNALSIVTQLEQLYQTYNRRIYADTDPIQFLYQYPCLRDREIVGLIASSLAYGNVRQINHSVSVVLSRMGDSPRQFLQDAAIHFLRNRFSDFVHRFADGSHLFSLLIAIKQTITQYGSLYEAFLSGVKPDHETILPGMSAFVSKMIRHGDPGHLLPKPERGSACKRLNLFLRWMVRRDEIDPGGWERMSPSKLIVPLDTHLHRLSLGLGLTCRKSADMRTALEITASFKKLAPADPVRYDFALTRLGIMRIPDEAAQRILNTIKLPNTNAAAVKSVVNSP